MGEHTVAIFREIGAASAPKGFGGFGLKLDSLVPFGKKGPEEMLKLITAGTAYAELKADRVPEQAMEALSKGKLVWAEAEGERKLGYYHMNPNGTKGGFVEITARVDGRSTVETSAAILGRSRIFASEIEQGCMVSDSSIRGSTIERFAVIDRGRLDNEHVHEGSVINGGRENWPTS